MRTNNNNVFRFLMGSLGWAVIILMALSTIACQDKVHFMAGIKGDPGAPGNDAPPVSIITAPAGPTQCAAGGTVLTVGTTVTIVCNGLSGTNGSDGSSCSTQALATGALISCTNGTSAYIANGAVGPAGASAPPSSSVTIVALCGGATVYPVNFVEVGICLNNKLYGVYSENSGFMTEIVPGAYHSNAHGNSCNLNVGLNCQVSH